MSATFRTLSLAGAALTANALRPVPVQPLAVPSFFAGWLTKELAPHNLTVTAVGLGAHLLRNGRRSDRVGVAADLVSLAGLGHVLRQSVQTRGVLERALREGLGEDWLQFVDPEPSEADLATPWRQVLLPFRMRLPEVGVVRDVQYVGKGGRHRLDVYRHRGPGAGRPVLVQVHGGAWMIGRKDQQGIPLMMHLAARGWVCVAANYRLSPRATWPDHLVDLKHVLSWVRQRVHEYGGDPGFVAVTGGSAGGHLAAMLALTPNDPRYQPGFEDVDTAVQACVPHYGVYDLADTLGRRDNTRRRDRFLAPLVFKRDPAVDPQVYESASPLCLVRPDAPPFFVLHGAHDTLVHHAEARAFVGRLRAVSHEPVVYAELPGTQHAFDIFPSIRSAHVVRGVELFLRHVLARHEQLPGVATA